MEKKTILGILMAFAIIGSVGFANAQGMTKPINLIETNTLVVYENSLLAGMTRTDGELHINGNLFVDEAEGWTGTCNSYEDLVVRDGIVIGCIGGEK